MLYINSKLGHINQTLTNRILQGDPSVISVYMPTFKDVVGDDIQGRERWVQVEIYRKDTVGNVL